jgi:hypothetical protein
MAAPTSLTNAAAQSLDTLYAADGTPLLKGGITGPSPTGITPAAGWQKAATHMDGATFGTGADGVSVAGVKDGSGHAVALNAGIAGTPAATVLTVQGNASGTPVPVSVAAAAGPATGTRSSVSAAVADTLLLAANTARKGATVYNDSTALLYLGLGATAVSTTNYSAQVPAGGYYEAPFAFAGQIRGYWVTATGAARVTELS